jgi:hypothetical protein
MENIELVQLILKRCGEVGLTPMLWGKHGIGKSQITRQVYEALGYEVVDLRLGQMEVGDLIGHPASSFYCPKCQTQYGFSARFTHCPMCEAEGAKIPIVGQMVWLPPSWFPQNGEKRCLFFDEFNRGRLDVQQAAFQIVLDRRIHTHKIPDNCAIVCACNPPSSDAGTGQEYNVEEIDPALMNRFVHIKFALTTGNWLKWAREKGIDQNIVDFIATEEKFLGNEAIDIPIEIAPTPRGYEFLNKLIGGESGIPRKYWADVAETVIGATAAISFVNSLKTDLDKPIKAQEIFKSFPKIRDRVVSQVEAGKGNTRFDLLRITLDEINDCLTGGKSSKYSDKELNNLADFFLLLPQDLAFSVLKDLALNNDINERLLLKRDDLFGILKVARKGDIG